MVSAVPDALIGFDGAPQTVERPVEGNPSDKDPLFTDPEKSGIAICKRSHPEQDEYWKRINTDSGAKAWQRIHGVHWRIARAYKGTSKSVLTAR